MRSTIHGRLAQWAGMTGASLCPSRSYLMMGRRIRPSPGGNRNATCGVGIRLAAGRRAGAGGPGRQAGRQGAVAGRGGAEAHLRLPEAQSDFYGKLREAKTAEECAKLSADGQPRPGPTAARLLELAEKNPTDKDVNPKALIWVVVNTANDPDARKARDKALAALARPRRQRRGRQPVHGPDAGAVGRGGEVPPRRGRGQPGGRGPGKSRTGPRRVPQEHGGDGAAAEGGPQSRQGSRVGLGPGPGGPAHGRRRRPDERGRREAVGSGGRPSSPTRRSTRPRWASWPAASYSSCATWRSARSRPRSRPTTSTGSRSS